MVLPGEDKRILMGKTADRLGVVRGRDELTARLESFAESQHKVPNLGQRKIIIGFIPETKQRSVSFVRGKHHGADHETFLPIGQILKGEAYTPLLAGKLDDQALRVGANLGILDVLQVGNDLLEILVDLGIGGWRVRQET